MGKRYANYFSEGNTWSDTTVFCQWFSDAFLPHIRTKKSHQTSIVMDHCGRHRSGLTKTNQRVNIYPLLPGCISIHQLMDLRVAAA